VTGCVTLRARRTTHMSWYLKTCGTKDEVTAAIDEAAAAQSGMPKAVADYLRGTVASVNLTDGQRLDAYAVLVESAGHRPMNPGGEEKCLVALVRRGPIRQPAT